MVLVEIPAGDEISRAVEVEDHRACLPRRFQKSRIAPRRPLPGWGDERQLVRVLRRSAGRRGEDASSEEGACEKAGGNAGEGAHTRRSKRLAPGRACRLSLAAVSHGRDCSGRLRRRSLSGFLRRSPFLPGHESLLLLWLARRPVPCSAPPPPVYYTLFSRRVQCLMRFFSVDDGCRQAALQLSGERRRTRLGRRSEIAPRGERREDLSPL